jgi:uncharacterized protein
LAGNASEVIDRQTAGYRCEDVRRALSLSPEGTIHSFTVIHTKAAFGLPEPYAVGYVDLERDGLRIFSLLDRQKIGQLHTGG